MEVEIFRNINNFNGRYQISNFGNVKSFVVSKKGRLLKPGIGKNGYKLVILYLPKFNLKEDIRFKGITRTVHSLVAEHFLNHNPCNYDIIIDHKDNNKLNNHEDNLRLVTPRENTNQLHNKSKFKSERLGVTRTSNNKSWKASITINNKRLHIGVFKDEDSAHEAYLLVLNLVQLGKSNELIKEVIKNKFRKYVNNK